MERFGRYVLLEKIAQGGMAEVFRTAVVGTAGFSKQIAIKRILPHLAQEQNFVKMLIDEAKIAATLTHPNILQVLDLGEERGVYFLAMEFLAGRPLNHIIAAGLQKQMRLPLPFCVHVVAQALDGLAFAHEKTDATGQQMHIIHRDISPQNIMIAFDGSVKLADFGIAKATQRSTDTMAGAIKGKPAYMAPEQVKTDVDVDQRADLYAMGIVLYEMIAMRRMRRSTDDVKLLVEALNGGYTTFEELQLPVPEEVCAVVYKALEPNREARFQTAREFSAALYDVLRARRWEAGPQQTSALLQQLFPDEIAREREQQNHFGAVMEQLNNATSGEVSAIIHREALETAGVAGNGDLPTPVRTGSGLTPPLDEERSRPRWLIPAAAAAGVALIGILAAAIAGGDPKPSRLAIETTPPGAEISVAGKPLPSFSPVVTDVTTAGAVVVSARLAGYKEARQLVEVKAGEALSVRITLEADEVTLPLNSTPQGATVNLDGFNVGITPLSLRLKSIAQSRLVVELPGYQRIERVLVPGELPASLELVLEKEPPKKEAREPSAVASGGVGTVTLQSKPWAKIFINGVDIKRFTPAANLQLKAGKHQVKLINEDTGLMAEFTITVRAGEALKVSKELR